MTPVEHEDAIVVPVEVDLSTTLEGGPEDQLTTFERVFKIVPSLCGRWRRQEQSGQRTQKSEPQNQHGMSSKTGRSYPQRASGIDGAIVSVKSVRSVVVRPHPYPRTSLISHSSTDTAAARRHPAGPPRAATAQSAAAPAPACHRHSSTALLRPQGAPRARPARQDRRSTRIPA